MKFRMHRGYRKQFVFAVLIFFFILSVTVKNVIGQEWILVVFNVLSVVFSALAVWLIFQSSERIYRLDEEERRLWGEF